MATYVMSDVHGLKEKYDRMLQELPLKDEDTLYVLGDVIDRGRDGILILQDIMNRKNVHMILGNHEYMMIRYYEAELEGKYELYEKLCIENQWEKNGCAPTKMQFERLSRKKQLEILAFLKALPIAYENVVVNDQHYYLVHACPGNIIGKEILYREDAKDTNFDVEHFVWDRILQPMELFDDRCVIIGHSPTMMMQDCHPYQIYTYEAPIEKAGLIDIDCGCAANCSASRLGVFCLDDRSVTYY